MSDYGHELKFGAFLTPLARPAHRAVELALLAERVGLDLVTFQDHPYQAAFHDTWTLLSFVAARTERLHLSGNVLNLPLRHPAMLARSAASLDRLSGGRVELALGSGAFWDGVEGMGGRRLAAGDSIRALEEAVDVIRGVWDVEQPGAVHVDGEFYRVPGAKRGPAPAHRIGVWLGTYGARSLRLTGRVADGWLPALPYLPEGLASLPGMNATIDEAAVAAGREPAAIRRLIDIPGRFTSDGPREPFVGPPAVWAEQIAELALEQGMSTFLLMSDDPDAVERFAEDVAPHVRNLVEQARATS